jgi:hypothetical protein
MWLILAAALFTQRLRRRRNGAKRPANQNRDVVHPYVHFAPMVCRSG